MKRLACIGEAMVEVARDRDDPAHARVGFAGDTLNTAIYAAREGRVAVECVTRVGRDSFSDDFVARARAEGVGTTLVGHSDTRTMGLYAVSTDAAGERSFAYWRSASAARELFDTPPPTLDDLAGFDAVYFSAITLAVISGRARSALFAWLRGYRANGGLVVFDSNYRPALWPDLATARGEIERAWRQTDIALPSVDDEMAIFGDSGADAVVGRLRAWGVSDGALKQGAAGPRSLGRAVHADYAPAERVVDTTAAGDSFNAGYLSARLSGSTQAEAMEAGHALASWVVGHPGAIAPRRG